MINLSIIVPVYNAESSIDACITSILDSYYLTANFTIEIICINDGSTDTTIEILEKFKRKHSFIKIINKENEGVYKARNIGLKAISGEYVWMIDADDYIKLNALNVIGNKIRQTEVDIIHFGYAQETKKGVFRKFELSTSFKESLIVDGLTFLEKNDGRLYLWNNVYNVKFLRNNSIKFLAKSKSLEDSLFNIEAFRAAKNVSFINDILYLYCFNQNSISRNHELSKLIVLRESTLNVHQQLLKIISSINRKNFREYTILQNKLKHSVLGFFYSLLMQNYPINLVKESLALYRKMNLYPVKFKSNSIKGNLFRKVLNIDWLYLSFCKLLRFFS